MHPLAPIARLLTSSRTPRWSSCSTQNIYLTRDKSASAWEPVDKIRIQYYEGSGTSATVATIDAAEAARYSSQAVGKPVRVQFHALDEHGWDNYGPDHLAEVRAGIDVDGNIVRMSTTDPAYLGGTETPSIWRAARLQRE